MSDWAIFGASIAFLVASVAAFRRLRRRRVDKAVEFALRFAMMEAVRRGHAATTIDHLAFALSFDPEVAARLRAAGATPASIRRRIDEHLGPLEEPGKLVPVPHIDEDVTVVIRSAIRRKLLVRPSDVLREIAHGPACFSKPLLPPPEAFDLSETPRRTLVDCDAEPTSAYRAAGGNLAGDTQVRLFNDNETKSTHVEETLTKMFGLTATCARYVVARVHDQGSAAIGPWPREDAAKLVAKATEAARAAGFPLRLALERSSLDA